MNYMRWMKTACLGTGLLVALSFLFPVALFAQLNTGTILGVVKDTTGAVVAGATVTVTNTQTGLARTGPSGPDGAYRFAALPVGNYQVRVTHEGFEVAERSGLTLQVTQEMVVDVTLQVGASTQTVEVTSAAPLVDTTSSAVGGTVDADRVADLPLNGRNWTDLSLMQPGVTKINIMLGTAIEPGQSGLVYSSNGGSIRSNMYLLDGADERTAAGFNNTSITNSTLGVDGIQEYKVVTVLPDAEYGLTEGSQTQLVSKSGTNQFHGDAYDYLRNASLDARNYFDALDQTNFNGFGTDKSAVYPGKRIPPFRRNDFGGAFGGPIKKDRTFFWAVFEGIDEGTGVTETKNTFPKACFVSPAAQTVLQPVVPAQIENTNAFGTCVTGNTSVFPNIVNGVINVNPVMVGLADVYPQPNVSEPTFNYTYPYIEPANEQFGQIRVDHTFSSADSVFFRYTDDESGEPNAYNFSTVGILLHSVERLGTLSETHVFSPTLVNTFRASYSFSLQSLLNAPEPAFQNDTAALFVQGNATTGPSTLEDISPGSGVSGIGGDLGPDNHLTNQTLTISDDVFWTKGKHALKFGVLSNYYMTLILGHYDWFGWITFGSLGSFFNGSYAQEQETPFNATTAGRDFHSNSYGFYAQDDYRVTSRLTLNLGLRYEFLTDPKEVNPALRYSWRNPATDTAPTYGSLFADPTYHNFAPRLGFAWDVFGNGRTAITGGAGIYYDIGNYEWAYGNNVLTPPITNTVIISNTATTPAIPLTVPLSGAFLGQSTGPVPGLALPSPRTVFYNLGQPGLMQRALTIEQQLPWQMGLNVGYVGTEAWDQFQQREGNNTVAVGTTPNDLPIYGCWNATVTLYQLPTANGACPTGYSSLGPRTNKTIGQAITGQSEGKSYYNALQISLNKRITQGLQFQFNYTWSKLLDNGQGPSYLESSTELWEVPDGYNQAPDVGPAIFDAEKNARINFIYHAPSLKSNGVLSKVGNGWWFSSILSFQSGYPITPVLGSDRALQNDINESERPNLDPSFNRATVTEGRVTQWFNYTMFDVPTAGTLGNSGRGILRGPGYEDVDFSIVKDTKAAFLGEAGNIEFRAEFFNLLNHANFALPTATVWSSGTPGTALAGQIGTAADPNFPTAGQITSTIGTSRQIQLALKILF